MTTRNAKPSARQHEISRRWSSVWPLAALSLLGSSRWLLEGGLPQLASTGLTAAAGCTLAGVFFLMPALRSVQRRRPSPFTQTGSGLGRSCAAALVLTAPALMRVVSGRNLHANDATLALALTPVVVAVATAARGVTHRDDLTGRLWPGLAGLAGLLLLLPQPGLSNPRLILAMVGLPVLLGTAASVVRLPTENCVASECGPTDRWEGSGLLLASLVLATLAFIQGIHTMAAFSATAALYDGMLAGLTLLLLRRLGPIRWSAQYILVPLLTLLEGALVLRPMLDLRSWLGFGLMAGSSLYLLL